MRSDLQVGQRIRLARREAGLSLSQTCGSEMTRPHLSLIERGLRGITAKKLIYLAGRLDRPLSWFLAEGVPEKAVVELLSEGETLSADGRYSAAAAVLQDILPLVPADNLTLRARSAAGLGFALTQLRQYDLAEPYLRDGVAFAERSGDLHLIAYARNAAGADHILRDEHAAALEHLEAAHAALRRHRRPKARYLAMVLLNMGLSLRYLGRHDAALRHLTEAAEVASRLGDPVATGMILRATALVLVETGALDRAAAYLEEARQQYARAERLDLVASAENGIGLLLIEAGRPEEAIPHLRRAVDLHGHRADDRSRARGLTELARADVLLRRYKTALPVAQEAIRLAMKVNDEAEAARAEALRGEILIARGEIKEAEAAFGFAIKVFERKGLRRDLARACATLGAALQARGRHAEASDALARAVALAAGGRATALTDLPI